MTHLNEETLNEYLDHSLNEVSRGEVEHHLATCAECQQNLDDLRLIFSALNSVMDVQPAADLSATILAQIMLDRRSSRAPTWLMIILVLQAVLAIILLFFFWPTTQKMIIGAGRGFSDIQAGLDIQWPFIRPGAWFNQLTSGLAQASDAVQLPFLLTTSQWITLIGLALIVWLVGNGVFLRGKNND